jgi:hypothetical protein
MNYDLLSVGRADPSPQSLFIHSHIDARRLSLFLSVDIRLCPFKV